MEEENKKIKIKEEWCKSCGLCIKVCPKDVIEYSDKQTVWGKIPYAANIEECIGCRQCEMICPDFAITYYEEEEGESDEK